MIFKEEKVTPSVAARGDTNPSDANAVSGPTLWNSLLTLTQFYAFAKTVLFCRAYETLPQRLRKGCRDCRAILFRDTRDSSFAVNDNDRVAVISVSVNDPFLAVPLR